jgi:hypothetical protein
LCRRCARFLNRGIVERGQDPSFCTGASVGFCWQLHVDIAIERGVEKCRDDIKVINLPTVQSSLAEHHDVSQGSQFPHWRIRLVEVDSFHLLKTSYHQACLLSYAAVGVPLGFEYPFRTNWLLTVNSSPIWKTESIVELDRGPLLLHRDAPVFMVWILRV